MQILSGSGTSINWVGGGGGGGETMNDSCDVELDNISNVTCHFNKNSI